MAQYKEGQRLQGSDGQVYVVVNGSPVRADSVAPQMPADPTFPYQGAKAAADVANTQANARANTVQADVAAATAPADIAKAQADAAKAAAEAERIRNEGAAGRPSLSPEAYAKAMAQVSGSRGLSDVIAGLEQAYKAGPGSTKGFRGIADYFWGQGNERFDTAANAARGTVAQALGFTGGQLNSAAEAEINLGAYIPKSRNFDGTIEDTIARLKELQINAFKNGVATLGGVPDVNGRVTPVPEGVPLNAMTIPRLVSGQTVQASEFGATTKAIPYPEAGQREHDALVADLITRGGGRIDPQAYLAAIAKIDAKYGRQGNPEADAAWVQGINDYLSKGGATIPTGIQPTMETMSFGEQFRNNLVNNPVGAAATSFADMGGVGLVSALAPEQMAALSEKRPLATALGSIGGAITGTSALGRLGAETIGRAVPRLLAGGGRSQLARRVGTDALYSAIYGSNTGQNPLEAAAWGAGGSVLGNTTGRAVGGVIGGFEPSAAVQRMRALGQEPTVGQTVGGWAKAMEEKATSMPIIGDMINARHMEGRAGFNEGAFDIGGQPVGAAGFQTGREGLEGLYNVKQAAYGNALDNVNLDVTAQPVAEGLTDAGLLASLIPQGVGNAAADSLEYRVGGGATPAGTMSGRDFQEAYRGLGRDRRTIQQGGYQHEYEGALRQGQDALATGLETQNPGAYADFLNANATNRRLEVLASAVDKAKNQERQLFTPKQLAAADAESTTRLTGKVNSAIGRGPFAQYADDGVEVFSNNTADSGTAGRGAQMLAGSSILGGGATLGGVAGAAGNSQDRGAGAAEGAATGAGSAALASALLLLGGTRTGQRLLTRGLADRPEMIRRAGRAVAEQRGLFGRAALPFALQGY